MPDMCLYIACYFCQVLSIYFEMQSGKYEALYQLLYQPSNNIKISLRCSTCYVVYVV